MWGAAISTVVGFFSEKTKAKTKIKEAKLGMKLAEINNKARLLNDESSNNHEWEMANLTDKDKWLRRSSFAMFSAPFMWALFDAQAVQDYFSVALSAMPEWYIQLYAGMVGGVWGFAALKNAVPAIIGGIRKAVK